MCGQITATQHTLNSILMFEFVLLFISSSDYFLFLVCFVLFSICKRASTTVDKSNKRFVKNEKNKNK